MRFSLSYFCINPHNSCLSKTHPTEMLPVLICKWKIHCLSGLHQYLLSHFSTELVRLSLPLSDLSFPPCRALAAHALVPGMLVHHNLNGLHSSKLWAVPPPRNVKALHAYVPSSLPWRIPQSSESRTSLFFLSRPKYTPFWDTLMGKWWLV